MDTHKLLVTPEDLDLWNEEPIHLPGSIQPYGLTIVCDPATGLIEQISDNVSGFTGRPPGAFLGQPLGQLMGWTQENTVRILAQLVPGKLKPLPSASIPCAPKIPSWEFLAHRSEIHGERRSVIVLEAVPDSNPALAVTDGTVFTDLARAITDLRSVETIEGFVQSCVETIQHFSCYDRVMLYRFAPDWSGEVIAEACSSGERLKYLGLNFPASDIPPQARRLYETNLLRIIADVDYLPSPLVALARDPIPVLDQSYCLLRSISPFHICYLKNMGVKATLTISLLHDGKLWGMVACHHTTPKIPPAHIRETVRVACGLIAGVITMRLDSLRSIEYASRRSEFSRILLGMSRRMAGEGSFHSAVESIRTILEGLFRSDSFCLRMGGQWVIPSVLGENAVTWLWDKLRDREPGQALRTLSLGEVPSGVAADLVKAGAVGLLACRVSLDTDSLVVFLRGERAREVRWAGSLSKTAEMAPNGSLILNPSRSFETWVQQVGGHCRGWSEIDEAYLRELCSLLSEQHLSHLQLRHEEELGRQVGLVKRTGRMAKVGGWELDVESMLLSWSGETYLIFNIAPDTLVTIETMCACFLPEAVHSFRAAIEAAISRRTDFDLELPLAVTEQTERWVALQGRVEVREGKVHFIAGTCQDVTERRSLEMQLRHSQKIQTVGQLAGGVAHDFNNMLLAMSMGLELMENMDLGPQPRELMEDMKTVLKRAAKLTRQLLMFARRNPAQVQVLQVGAAIQSMHSMLKTLVGEVIEIRLSLREPDLSIDFDSGMFDQILLNLSVNARDAMGVKGGVLSITTKECVLTEEEARINPEARPGNFVFLSVSDTGVGMSKDTKEHLFEPFFTTKEVGKGTGLGLASVYGIVKQHGGWIRADSQLGEGSTFRIYLPQSKQGNSSQASAPVTSPTLGGRETILLVEDDEMVRNAVVKSLSSIGYTLLVASQASEALDLWARHKASIDLLLSDVLMPGGQSGPELAVKIRSEHPSLPVIFMSGYPEDLLGKVDSSRLAFVFLQKPFETVELSKVLRNSLDAGASLGCEL